MRFFTCAAGAAAFLTAIAAAAPAAAAGDSQLWAGGIVGAKLSDHWRLWEEVTARFLGTAFARLFATLDGYTVADIAGQANSRPASCNGLPQ